jgi:hypothetical protein
MDGYEGKGKQTYSDEVSSAHSLSNCPRAAGTGRGAHGLALGQEGQRAWVPVLYYAPIKHVVELSAQQCLLLSSFALMNWLGHLVLALAGQEATSVAVGP